MEKQHVAPTEKQTSHLLMQTFLALYFYAGGPPPDMMLEGEPPAS